MFITKAKLSEIEAAIAGLRLANNEAHQNIIRSLDALIDEKIKEKYAFVAEHNADLHKINISLHDKIFNLECAVESIVARQATDFRAITKAKKPRDNPEPRLPIGRRKTKRG